MSVLVANYAEGGTDGVAVTTGNSGGGSGTAFGAVTGTWTFSNVQAFEGVLSYRSAQVGGTAQALQVPLGTAATSAVHTVAQYLTAFPASSFIVIKGLTAGFGASWRIDVTAAGLVRIRNSANTQVAESVAAISINQWWRFKITVVNSTTVGSVSVDAYSGYSDTPSFTLTIGSINTATEHSHVQIGNSLSTPTLGTTYYDAYIADTTSILAVDVVQSAGGGSAGSSSVEPALDVLLAQSAGGATAGSSSVDPAVGVNVDQGAGGSQAGSTPQAPTVGVEATGTPGGAQAGSTPQGVLFDVLAQQGAGGAQAGSTPQGLTIDQVITASPGGAQAGATPQAPLVDVVVQLGAGGGSAAGTAQEPDSASPVTIPGTPGGGTAGSTPQDVQADIVITASPGGGQAGSTLNIQAADVFLVQGAGGGTLGSTRQDVPASGDVTITPTAGGATAGSTANQPANRVVVQDTMVMPIAVQAMGCLQDALVSVPSPPLNYHIRPGIGFSAFADATRDECCEGIAWVRPGQMFETDEFPQPRTNSSNLPPLDYAITMELGVMRCVPIVGPGPGDVLVTAAQWHAATQELLDDAAAIRRAICCLRELLGDDAVVAGPLIPLENEATCMGQTTLLTIRVNPCDCYDLEP